MKLAREPGYSVRISSSPDSLFDRLSFHPLSFDRLSRFWPFVVWPFVVWPFVVWPFVVWPFVVWPYVVWLYVGDSFPSVQISIITFSYGCVFRGSIKTITITTRYRLHLIQDFSTLYIYIHPSLGTAYRSIQAVSVCHVLASEFLQFWASRTIVAPLIQYHRNTEPRLNTDLVNSRPQCRPP